MANLTPLPSCIERLEYANSVRNPPDHIFQTNYPNFPSISNFICYIVGQVKGTRIAHSIRILQKLPTDDTLTTFHLQWFNYFDEKDEPIQFWVHSGVTLRKFFFMHEDKLSFLRASFIYDEKSNQFFRLSNIFQYLYVEETNPKNSPIYRSPSKYYIYVRTKFISMEEKTKKRKKEFISSLKKTIRKHNGDNFVEMYFPKLFQEYNSLIS